MMRSCLVGALAFLLMIHSSVGVYGEEAKSASMIRCKEHELEALLKFKHSFTKDPTNRLSSWVGVDCCQWLGVGCDNVTGNVIKLNLKNMSPYFDDCARREGSLVSSRLSSALVELEFLRHLDLNGNDFSGSRIPAFIGSMRHLRYLDLSRAGFSGPLPPQLGNLTNLIRLDIHVAFECIGPAGLYTESLGWASGLSKLRFLDMGSCSLAEANDSIHVLMGLPSLEFLSLSACQIPITHLSEALFADTTKPFFHSLQKLDLSYNSLEGPLPSTLQNLVSLQSLTLSFNSLNGSIPLWFRNMTNLQVLKLRSNEFSHVEGGMWGIMGNPCNFQYLDLSDNLIVQGDILEPFANLSTCATYDFRYLDLGDNSKLGGNLSSLLGEFRYLEHLDLSNNGFEGRIPFSFVKLPALKYLDLSVNRLSGMISDSLGHLTNIEHLDMSSNSIQGTISGIDNLPKLSYFDVSFNHFKLNLSFSHGPCFALQVFRVHSCEVNTVFPKWLRNQTQIERLDLSYAGISGKLPEWLWNMTNLQTLQLSGNQLTGSLPRHVTCDGCDLWLLDLHNNFLSGSIPHWLSQLGKINVIDLSGNLLSGRTFQGENASSFLTGRNSLDVLDLSHNMLTGEIHVRNVKPGASLEILSLRGNDFHGPIRSQLCHFQSLRILELAQNRLTGHIPRCLGSVQFDSDNGGYISDTGLEFEEVVKGITEVFAGTKGTQSIIDFSNNQLVGTIPEELTNISKLEALNLSNNHLTGAIPGHIGNLKMLESLDLSNNQLSGTIPQSLSDVSWLSSLNLSNNNLHGPIPSGSQLQTLDNPSIYAGNSGLCGFPLPDKCNKLDRPPSSTNVDPSAGEDEKEEDEIEDIWFYLAIMMGVGTGFWGVVGTLVVNKRWRQAYFRFVQESAETFYVRFKAMTNWFKRRW